MSSTLYTPTKTVGKIGLKGLRSYAILQHAIPLLHGSFEALKNAKTRGAGSIPNVDWIYGRCPFIVCKNCSSQAIISDRAAEIYFHVKSLRQGTRPPILAFFPLTAAIISSWVFGPTLEKQWRSLLLTSVLDTRVRSEIRKTVSNCPYRTGSVNYIYSSFKTKPRHLLEYTYREDANDKNDGLFRTYTARDTVVMVTNNLRNADVGRWRC